MSYILSFQENWGIVSLINFVFHRLFSILVFCCCCQDLEEEELLQAQRLDERIQEHVRNIKEWREKTDAPITLQQELQETKKNLEKVYLLNSTILGVFIECQDSRSLVDRPSKGRSTGLFLNFIYWLIT